MRLAVWKIIALAVVLVAIHTAVYAQGNAGAYPSKPIRWLVGFAPGASNDIIARLIAARLTESFGQQVLVDNRGGAGGIIAGEIVAKSAPDGYTLIMSTGGPSVSGPLLAKRAPYRVEDFTQTIVIGYTPLVIVAHPAFPARNPRELVDYAKANPGKITWGSSGIGGSPHFGLLVFQAATGIEVTHVPYKGTSLALTDIAAGQIQAMHASVISSEAHLAARRLKIIGVGSAKRLANLPDIPTYAEHGIVNGESVVWFGVATAPATPRPITLKLNNAVNRVLQNPDAIRRMQELGLEVLGGTPEDAEAFVKREAAMVRRLIKLGKIRPE
ncbi:MAG TPA: tripartite tricarboxylate transporter substrate-binding protein [Burkholderiales bacterium]|nr:tripartite tricarboxylate transporter substrate-binding protein [Burkholderiales bacterium]